MGAPGLWKRPWGLRNTPAVHADISPVPRLRACQRLLARQREAIGHGNRISSRSTSPGVSVVAEAVGRAVAPNCGCILVEGVDSGHALG